ncbi:MAG: peptidylprolyl isomerase [Candidatus Binatia bacterium]
MQVASGSVVSFHYTLSSDDGVVIDSSKGRAPFTYLHGYQTLNLTSLEEELTGQQPGEEIVLTLAPEQVFGDYDPHKIQELPREAFPETDAFTPGARYTTVTPEGKEISFSVVDIQPTVVIVDFNHPLAGQKAVLAVKVEEVRQATPEECLQGRPL